MIYYKQVMIMKQKYIITAEDSAKIKEYRKQVKDKYLDRRLYAVQLLGEGKTTKEISSKLDADRRQISVWASNYVKKGGIDGLLDKRGGRYRENMSKDEEQAFLEKFKEKAEKGQVVSVKEIQDEYDKAVGHETKPTFIYTVLRRNGWRKVMPRSRHPKKACDEAINASKKLKLL